MQLRVKITGNILPKLKNAESETRRRLKAAVLDASTDLFQDIARATPASTGNLLRSIRREIAPSGLSAAIFTDLDYGIQLHGEVDANGELREDRSEPFLIEAKEAEEGGTLYRWAKKHGLNPWAVRGLIAKRGIKHNPWLVRTALEDRDKTRAFFVGALDGIKDFLSD